MKIMKNDERKRLRNDSGRPIALHCNSGKTLHLPPGYEHEISEQEIVGNALVEKLKSRKLISVKAAKSGGSGKAAVKTAEKPGSKKATPKVAAKKAAL